MAIRRPPTTFSDSITGADLASDIAISTTGNIATTGSGTLSVAGNSTLSGTNNLGSNPTITLGANATFPTRMVLKTYYAENTTRSTTALSINTWHNISGLSITTDVPKSTSSDFLLFASVHSTINDWSPKCRFYNTTTSSAISIGTNPQSLQEPAGFVGYNYPAGNNTIYNHTGFGFQTNNTGVAQTFKVQIFAGRGSGGIYLNRTYTDTNDDISGNSVISSFIVMEIA